MNQRLKRRVVSLHLHEPLVLRRPTLHCKQLLTGLELLAGLQVLLRFGHHLVGNAELLLVESRNDGVELLERRGRVTPNRTRDDERRTRLIDQDRVDFIDNRESIFTLHPLLERVHHVVAQIVEAVLVVGAVCDIRVVRSLPLR